MGNFDVIMALLNKGSNVNTAVHQRSGSTALIQASHFGHVRFRIFALCPEKRISIALHIFSSPFSNRHCYFFFVKVAIVELLLCHGAEVDKANLKNTTALMRACQEGHEVRVYYSGNVEIGK